MLPVNRACCLSPGLTADGGRCLCRVCGRPEVLNIARRTARAPWEVETSPTKGRIGWGEERTPWAWAHLRRGQK